MLQTQAFANLCNTTKKTIIYYDRIGLLRPASHRNKFRLYKPRQVLTFQKIILLKTLGLTLLEVKKYLHRGKALKQLLLNQHYQLGKQKETLEKRVAKIDEFLQNLKKGKPMVVPKIKKVGPYFIYGRETVGRYVDIDRHQREIFSLLGKKFFRRPGVTIFREPYFSPAKADMVTGVVIKGQKPKELEGVKIIKVPAYKAVSYTHVGPYSYMSYIWQFLDKYVEENKLKRHPRLDCREFYIVGALREEDEDDFITELQIPIV